jgi:methionyl-tRNA synthetase
VIPEFRQAELRNAAERISGDLCISRPKSRLDWGIELPFDKDFVTYVWFDALTNYISFAGYDPTLSTLNSQPSTFRDKWPALQIIGKDILVPAHGIYWLIMLHAVGFPDEAMPQLLVHGWWNLGGAKMSKSAGNIIDPFVLTEKYGADALRYYLMSDIATGKDADFSEQRILTAHNDALANSLGNLLNRTLQMTGRFCDSTLRINRASKMFNDYQGKWEAHDAWRDNLTSGYESYHLESALAVHRIIVAAFNRLVEDKRPWDLAKAAQAKAKKEELFDVLYVVAESLRIIAILISPVIPKAAHGIFDQLNWKMELSGKEERFSLADAEWGRLPDGHVVGKPVPLFPRIETTD